VARDAKQERTTGPLAQSTASALQGRQSVRATFRLSASCIEAITVVATQLGIKQKSLFDHIAEDIKLLELIANQAGEDQIGHRSRVQKTYVVSRRSLHSLEEIARTFNTPRDTLIERSVKRLLPLIEREQARHRQRKQILESVETHFAEGQNILKHIKARLGGDDPVYDKLEGAMGVYANVLNQIAAIVAKGEIIEDFDIEALRKSL
jgi:hypothetical protein